MPANLGLKRPRSLCHLADSCGFAHSDTCVNGATCSSESVTGPLSEFLQLTNRFPCVGKDIHFWLGVISGDVIVTMRRSCAGVALE